MSRLNHEKKMRKWSKILVIMIFVGFMSACSSYQPANVTISQDFAIIHPEPPMELNLYDDDFTVLNKDIIKELSQTDNPANLVCLSPQGYTSYTHNVAEYKRYILQQQQIINYYRKTVPSVN